MAGTSRDARIRDGLGLATLSNAWCALLATSDPIRHSRLVLSRHIRDHVELGGRFCLCVGRAAASLFASGRRWRRAHARRLLTVNVELLQCVLFTPYPVHPFLADWRVAGLSYNKYSSLCADLVRSALKSDIKAKAKLQETVYFRSAKWENGVPGKQGA